MTAKKNKKIFKQKYGPSNPKKVHFNLIIISFWLFKDCGAKLITVFCQTINIFYKSNYLFTGIFYISFKGNYQRFLKFCFQCIFRTIVQMQDEENYFRDTFVLAIMLMPSNNG